MTEEQDTKTDHEATAKERARLLHDIWTRQARAVANILEETPTSKLKASMLASVNSFLKLNGVSFDTLPDPNADAREESTLAQKIKALDPADEGPDAGALVREAAEGDMGDDVEAGGC